VGLGVAPGDASAPGEAQQVGAAIALPGHPGHDGIEIFHPRLRGDAEWVGRRLGLAIAADREGDGSKTHFANGVHQGVAVVVGEAEVVHGLTGQVGSLHQHHHLLGPGVEALGADGEATRGSGNKQVLDVGHEAA
jgi:hypothetical protein